MLVIVAVGNVPREVNLVHPDGPRLPKSDSNEGASQVASRNTEVMVPMEYYENSRDSSGRPYAQ